MSRKESKRLLALAIASASALTPWITQANVIDWSSTAGNASWATPGNWVLGSAPHNDLITDIARFDQTSYAFQPNAGTTSINGLQIGDGTTATATLTLSTTALSIGSGGISMYANAGNASIGAIKLGGNQSWSNNSSSLLTLSSTISNVGNTTPYTLTIGNTTGNITLSGIISDGGSIGTTAVVVNTTSGNTTLYGGNTFTGGLTIKSGTVVGTGSNDAGVFGKGGITLGDTSGTANATLIYLQGGNITQPITVQSGSSSNTLTMMATGSTSDIFSGAVSLGHDLVLAAAASKVTTLSGQITGSSKIIVGSINAGTVALLGANGSSFTGNTTINAGILNFGNTALGTGSVIFGGNATLGWLDTSTPQHISSSTGFTGNLSLGTNNVTLATTNSLTGSGNLTKLYSGNATAGILTLAAANDLSGNYTTSATTGAAGTTLLKNSNALQNASVYLNSNNGGGITFDSSVSPHTFTFGGLTGGGYVSLQDNAGSPDPVTLYVGNNSQTLAAYTGVLSGSGSLIKIGTGNLAVNAQPSSSGGINVYNGTLSTNQQTTPFGTSNALSLGDPTPGNSNNATLSFAYATSATITNATNITVNAGSSGTLTIANPNNLNAFTQNGTLTLNNNLTVDNATVNKTTTYAGAVSTGSSPVTLTKNGGAGNVAISGGVTLGGNLTLANSGSGGPFQVTTAGISGVGNLTINANGSSIFTVSAGVNNSGLLTNSGSSSGATTISGNVGVNVTGVVQNSAGSVLTLSGNDSSFVGNLSVVSGKVLLGNVAALNSHNTVTLFSGGTLDLNAKSNTIAGLNDGSSGAGETATNSGAAAILTLGGNGTYSFGGNVTATTLANLALTVALTGGGCQTLSGANTYTGNTAVTGGTLYAGAVNTLSSGSAMTISGGTLDVSGYANPVKSLSMTSGSLNLGAGNTLTSTGAASLTGGTVNIGGSPTLGNYTLLAASTLTTGYSQGTIPGGYRVAVSSSALNLIHEATVTLAGDSTNNINVRPGTATFGVNITNTAPTGSDAGNYSLGGALSGTGSLTPLAGATHTTGTYTAVAGNNTNTVTISNTGSNTWANTPGNVTITQTAYDYANPTVGNVAFSIVHVGDVVSQPLAVTNATITNASYQDNLSGCLSSVWRQ